MTSSNSEMSLTMKMEVDEDFMEDPSDIVTVTPDEAGQIQVENSTESELNGVAQGSSPMDTSANSVNVLKRHANKSKKASLSELEIFDYKSQKTRKPVPLKIKISKTVEQKSDGKIQCLLCEGHYESYHKLLLHLSVSHYKEELSSLFEVDGDNWICPLCGKTFDTNLIYINRRCIHLGAAHEHILNVAHKAVKAQLDNLRVLRRSFEFTELAWDRCRTHFLLYGGGKGACCVKYTCGPQELRHHLATTHYKNDLVSAYGKVGAPCKYCKKEILPVRVATSKKDIVLHILLTHPTVLYDLMPDKDAELLSHCLRRKSSNNTVVIPNDYKCPLCDLSHEKPGLLRRHMSTNHFGSELLQAANVKRNYKNCTLCGQVIGGPMTVNSDLKRRLSAHIGCKHGYLDKVMPDELRKTVKDMELKCLGQAIHTKSQNDPSCSKPENQLKCPTCPMIFQKPNNLKNHVANQHYRDQMFSLAGLTDCRQCPICGKKIRNKDTASDKCVMARHIGFAHKYVDRLMSAEVKEKFNQQLLKIKLQPGRKKKKEENKCLPRLRSLDNDTDRHIPCMLCESKFNTVRELRHHLILKHFKVAILKKADAKDARKCSLCDQPMGSENMSMSVMVCHMAVHVGNTHNFLDEVIPDEIKHRLESITEAETHKRRKKQKHDFEQTYQASL